jgi:intein/homing endonuclease
MEQFDLFKLYQPIDIGAKSWICFSGKDLWSLIDKSVEKSGISRKKIVNKLSKRLNCCYGPFEEVFYNKKEWIPLPMLNYLVEQGIISKIEILRSVERLKVNSAKARPLKAVKHLNKTLCKIAGAFSADGNLHVRIGFYDKPLKKHRIRMRLDEASELIETVSKNRRMWQEYALDLTDESKLSVMKYKKWIENLFGISISRPVKFRNAWRLNFSNKIVARYFHLFLDFPYGRKTKTVSEPLIIRKSSIEDRNAFLQGALTFDGCINKKGNIYFVSKSKNFINSIKEIMIRNKLDPRLYYDIKRSRWQIRLIRSDTKKSSFMFVKNTPKWQRLNDFYGL